MVLSNLKYDSIKYLMGSRHPAWIKYQTLVKILDRSENDPEVKLYKEKRDRSAIVRRIREKQHQDGSFLCMPWMHIHKYYFHQMLEMGFGIDDVTVKNCVENLLLRKQQPNGSWLFCGKSSPWYTIEVLTVLGKLIQ